MVGLSDAAKTQYITSLGNRMQKSCAVIKNVMYKLFDSRHSDDIC